MAYNPKSIYLNGVKWDIQTQLDNLSGSNLQSQINSISGNYTSLVTTNNISSNLQSQINGVSQSLSGYQTTNSALISTNNLLNLINSKTSNVIINGITGTTFNISGVGSITTVTNGNTILISGGNSQSVGSSLLTISPQITASFTVSYDVSLCNSSYDTGFTATLPTAIGNSGKMYRIKKIDAYINKVRVNCTSTQTIDESTYFDILNQYDVLSVVSDGYNWQVI